MKALMNSKWLRSGFFARHRIKIVMCALVAEMLASPLADSHPRAGALLGLTVLLMVLAGIVNKSLVAAIAAAGQPAIGLCGGDGGVFRARKKQDAEYDLGFVGEICFSEPRWLKAIWAEGGIPVLSSLALGGDGQYYNVNADQMAAACAIACEADALIFLTDVPGVKQADGSVIPRLDTKQVAGLIEESVVSGGMMPKLEACTQALKSGVGRVRILPAAQVEMLPLFYFTKLECGTEVLRA